MDYKEIIDKLVRELSYRVGIPNIHNKEHQSIMSEILSEWGEYDIKETIFRDISNNTWGHRIYPSITEKALRRFLKQFFNCYSIKYTSTNTYTIFKCWCRNTYARKHSC